MWEKQVWRMVCENGFSGGCRLLICLSGNKMMTYYTFRSILSRLIYLLKNNSESWVWLFPHHDDDEDENRGKLTRIVT